MNTFDDHLASIRALPEPLASCECGKEEGVAGEFGELVECSECRSIRLRGNLSIHQKINAKGNMKSWFGSKSFHTKIQQAMKEGYKMQEDYKVGERFFYQQDRKTNYFDHTPWETKY